jgi:hypothetical protein
MLMYLVKGVERHQDKQYKMLTTPPSADRQLHWDVSYRGGCNRLFQLRWYPNIVSLEFAFAIAS